MNIDKTDMIEYSVLSVIFLGLPSLYWYVTGHTEAALAGFLLAVLFSDAVRFFTALAAAAVMGLCVYRFWTELMPDFQNSIGEIVVTFVFMLYVFIRGYATVN